MNKTPDKFRNLITMGIHLFVVSHTFQTKKRECIFTCLEESSLQPGGLKLKEFIN